jgi:hypothetical protein
MGEMGGFSFEDVKGIGDEARESTADGELWVRVGNMTFITRAYRGDKMPTPKIEMKAGDTKAYMKKMMAANREWTKKTLPERQKATRKLTRAIIEKL